MRWEALFADLEAQLEAARSAELSADVAELTRAERATVELSSRLRSAHGQVLTVRSGPARVTGTVLDAVIGAVSELVDLPLEEQVTAFEAAHGELRATLDHADSPSRA